jgi:hypothetical protein
MIFSSVLVARMGVVMEKNRLGAQVGFRWNRGAIDGLFTTFVGLFKRKEHGLEAWALFIDLVRALIKQGSERGAFRCAAAVRPP